MLDIPTRPHQLVLCLHHHDFLKQRGTIVRSLKVMVFWYVIPYVFVDLYHLGGMCFLLMSWRLNEWVSNNSTVVCVMAVTIQLSRMNVSSDDVPTTLIIYNHDLDVRESQCLGYWPFIITHFNRLFWPFVADFLYYSYRASCYSHYNNQLICWIKYICNLL